jgi:hypothetical protein
VPATKINVNLIRAFEGPRHARLEQIWQKYARQYEDRMHLHVFDNLGAKLNHADCLEAIWEAETRRPERYTIFTEFDFLPGPDFLKAPSSAVEAASYVTRNPGTRNLTIFNKAGAWFVAIDKQLGGDLRGAFRVGGAHNDPANLLADHLRRAGGPGCRLLESEDCYPRHYGVKVAMRGEHLFFSRHYGDPPHLRIAGLPLGDIQRKIDAVVADYENRL